MVNKVKSVENKRKLLISEEKRVAYNFRRLRGQKKWTQEETARKGKVSRTYIARLEIANVGLGPSGQKKWAGVFGVDISEFFKPITDEGNGIPPGGPGKGKPELENCTFNLDLMREIIEIIEEIFQKKRLHLPPKKKAELMTLLYEEISEDRSKIVSLPGKVVKLTRLAS